MSSEDRKGWKRGGRTIAGLFGLALLFVFSTAQTCGGLDDSSHESCLEDIDCFGDSICLMGECASRCDSEGDCGFSEICATVPRGGESVQACIFDESNANNSLESECFSDAECQMNDDRAQCSVDGFCFVPETVSAILIEDTTPLEATEQPSDGAAGADIAAVMLLDESGEAFAWADTLVARDRDGNRVPSPLDGRPPVLTEGGDCLEGGIGEVSVSLGGAGGFLLARFVDAEGRPVDTRPLEWRIKIIEWSSNCDTGVEADQESVRVAGCEGATFDSLQFEKDCTIEFGDSINGVETLEATTP